jgi:hypothetical protein
MIVFRGVWEGGWWGQGSCLKGHVARGAYHNLIIDERDTTRALPLSLSYTTPHTRPPYPPQHTQMISTRWGMGTHLTT